MRSTSLAAPLLLALQRAVLEREAWPHLRVALPEQEAGFWAAARDVHLDSFPPLDLAEASGVDAAITIQAPENTRALAGVDPAMLSRAALARAPVREAALARRWCVSVWPTPALAQQADMSSADFAAFVRRALFLDRDDPVAAWRDLSSMQAQLISKLAAASELRIEGEGTDLRAVGGGSYVDQLGWAAEHAFGRGVHRAGRDVRLGSRAVRRAVLAAGRGGLRGGALVPRGGRRLRPRGPRRRRAPGHARHRRRRPPARRDRDRHELRHRPRRSG